MLIFIRGLPGSGKTTVARTLSKTSRYICSVAADDWFELFNDGVFEASELKQAHAYCQRVARNFCEADARNVTIIHNTGTRQWEIEPYRKIAAETGHMFALLKAEGKFQNVHGVPDATIDAMRNRWED